MKLQYVLHLSLLVVLFTGCHSRRANSYVTNTKIDAPAGSAQSDHLWESAQDALRNYRFRLDRIDRQAGVITTLPMGSKHFFEVWRKDVATCQDFWESTVNPVRRWVEVRFTPGDGQAWSQVEVVVHKERLSTRDRQFNSTVAAYQFFGDTLPATTGEIRPGALAEQWIDLGRDPALEAKLLQGITEQAASPEIEG
jgi:hypothetical protein